MTRQGSLYLWSLCTSFFHYLLHFLILLSALFSSIVFTFSFFSLHFFLPLSSLSHSSLCTSFFHYLLHFLVLLSALLSSIVFFTFSFFSLHFFLLLSSSLSHSFVFLHVFRSLLFLACSRSFFYPTVRMFDLQIYRTNIDEIW